MSIPRLVHGIRIQANRRVSKSQLAITYAHRAREERPDCWMFWVHASNPTRFEEGYKAIAERAQLRGWNEPKADILGLVRSWLSNENNGHWVMIVDNTDAAAVMFEPISGSTLLTGQMDRSLSDYIPQVSHGSVVITSRSRDVAYRLTGRMEDILDVLPMDVNTSMALLRKKLGDDANDEDAVRLVRTLDGMPLAITQAAAHIHRRAPRMTVARYLQELSRSDADRARLLQRDVGDLRRDGQASNSIITTWHVSFAYLRQERPSAARLLALMSLFDREGIPASLLHEYTEDGEGDADFEDDIDTLRSYCLVGVGGKDDTFEMHQLVQFSMKKWLEQQGELQRWQEWYIDKMSEVFPTGQYENWVKCEELFPHAEMALLYRPAAAEYLTPWATVLYNVSWYSKESGRYARAEVMVRESLTAREKVLGREHLITLLSVNMLALVLQDQGQYEAAEEMSRRVLAGYEKVLGHEHPDTLTSVSNLAMVLQDQGQYEAAKEMNQRALEGREKVLGREHPDTLKSVGNLAAVLAYQGQYEAAKEMNQWALEGRKKVLGREHPDTLVSVGNLAVVLRYQGQYEAAQEMSRQALEGREKVLGHEHPYTLTSVSNLALVLQNQGQDEAAKEMNQRALEGREKVLGREHPDTLTSVGNLALVLQIQGQYKAAEEMNRRALEGREKVLDQEHPDTLASVNNLALVLQYQGQYEAAEKMSRRAMEGYEKVLGGEHPNTLASVYCLASSLQATSQFEEALIMYERACKGYQEKLGSDHLTTRACQDDLASMLKEMQNMSTNASQGRDVVATERDDENSLRQICCTKLG